MAITASGKSAVSRPARSLLPAYLFLCLILGGSSRASWGGVALQAIAPWLIAYAALADRSVEQTRSSRLLLWLLGAWFALVLLQLVPLPPALWTQLPGRETLADGYRELGFALPWLPLSMAPYDHLRALVTLLPPAAALLMMLAPQAERGRDRRRNRHCRNGRRDARRVADRRRRSRPVAMVPL